MRKISFWNRGHHNSTGVRRKSRPGSRRSSSLRTVKLGIETFEERFMLAANPLLTVPAGQFFAEAAPVTSAIPFRATFSDAIDTLDETASFTTTIDWGDGNVESSGLSNDTQTLAYHPIIPIQNPTTSPGDPIVGRLEALHSYADVGEYNVSVKLTNNNTGLFTVITTTVSVYEVDPDIEIVGAAGDDAAEGSPFTVNLSDGGNSNITSWTINWGDTIETFTGNPADATHTFGDDRNYGHFDPTVPNHESSLTGAFIGATVTRGGDTFVIGTPYHANVNDVPAIANVIGASDVNENQPYVLDLSYTDPGDPLQNWFIAWDFDGATYTEFSILPPDATSASHVYSNGEASYTVIVIAANGFDSPGSFIELNVHAAPTADFASGGVVSEGSDAAVSFSNSFSSNGDDVMAGFRYSYDFNNDGSWEIGDGTYAGSVTNVSATVLSSFVPDGDASYSVKGRIIGQSEAFNDYIAQVVVTNVAPTANAGGPYATFEDTPVVLSGSATDPAGAADTLAYSWDLDGDDIFGETGAGATHGNEVGPTVTFDPTGYSASTKTVKLRVTDEDGGVSNVTTTVQIQGQGTVLVGGVLYVIGSNTNDIAAISQVGSTISVFASPNGSNPVSFNAADVNEIQVRMRGGNDVLVTTPNVTKLMTIDGGSGNDLLTGGGGRNIIFGGAGNDVIYGDAGDDVIFGGDGNDDLIGGGGNDVLVGGSGNDILSGGFGRDVLIGGQDNDKITGGDDEDVLIGGVTIHDSTVSSLDAVMAIWGSGASFNSRVATLTSAGGLLQPGVAVFDDDDHDVLDGGAGRDLYFGDNNPWDHVVDQIKLQSLQDQLIAVT